MQISLVSKDIKVDSSNISNKGVFAVRKIKKGNRIAIFGGFVVSLKDLPRIKTAHPKSYNTILDIGYQVDDDAIFAPTSRLQFSPIEYLNHSCEPNAGFDGPIHLIAIKDIAAGEEITMDYAMCISVRLFDFKCDCGATACRKQIFSSDWKKKELQKKYGKYFQPYLQKKIYKHR